MAEGYGISLPHPGIVISLFKSLKPCFVVNIIKGKKAAWEELFYLRYQVLSWMPVIQRIVTS